MKNRNLKYFWLGILLLSSPLYAATAVIQDFSGTSVDIFKTGKIESSILLNDEKVELFSRALSSNPGITKNRSNRTRLRFQDTTSPSIQANLSIKSYSLGNNSTQQAMVRLGGGYYNTESANPTTNLGDVSVRIAFGNRGNGLEAWYEIYESLNDDFSEEQATFGIIDDITEFAIDTEYAAEISYDGNKTFTFTFNGQTKIVVYDDRIGDPSFNSRFAETRLRFAQDNSTVELEDTIESDGSVASITATVDDLVTSEINEDFSGSDLDSENFKEAKNGQFSQLIDNGKLKIVAIGTDNSKKRSYLFVDQVTDFLGAKMTLQSSSTKDANSQNRVRLTGDWYNDTYDENVAGDGKEGNVWARTSLLRKSDGEVVCLVAAERIDDANHLTATDLFYEEDNCQMDTEYDMSIEKTDTSLIFRRDGSITKTHVITTPIYPVKNNNGDKSVRSEVRDGAGETHALFDDVTIDYDPVDIDLNAKNANGDEVDFPENVVVNEEEIVTLIANVSDPSKVDTYIWEQTSGTEVTPVVSGRTANRVVGSDETFSFTVPVGSDTETLAFKVTIIDELGLQSSQDFDISVDNSQDSTLPDLVASSGGGSTGGGSSSGGGGGGSSGAFFPWFLFLIWIIYLGKVRLRQ